MYDKSRVTHTELFTKEERNGKSLSFLHMLLLTPYTIRKCNKIDRYSS